MSSSSLGVGRLAPLLGNPAAWKMLATWSEVYTITDRAKRRKRWAEVTALDELAIGVNERAVLRFCQPGGKIDPEAARFVKERVEAVTGPLSPRNMFKDLFEQARRSKKRKQTRIGFEPPRSIPAAPRRPGKVARRAKRR